MKLRAILAQVEAGKLSAAQALELLGEHAEKNLGFARVDTDRLHRRGFPEVIFCPGKTAEQIADIMAALKANGQNAFATRATPEQYAAIRTRLPAAVYHAAARAITLDVAPLPRPSGLVAVVSAGTSDIPVAEEAALTAERLGARVERIFDVGVAGLHRLLKHVDLLRRARALVVVAGLEGALPSVIGGLVDRPIVAVPTSIGYGASFQGVAALLAMLNSCAPGVAVVNIDNGFGAGVTAALINRNGGIHARSEFRAPVHDGPHGRPHGKVSARHRL
jgi:NCAIR mutase (PurE)-related protein